MLKSCFAGCDSGKRGLISWINWTEARTDTICFPIALKEVAAAQIDGDLIMVMEMVMDST
jgi:hypothetical protein